MEIGQIDTFEIELTPNVQTTLTIGAVSALLLPATLLRKHITILNTDNTKTLYIHFGAGAATTTNGYPLKPLDKYNFPVSFNNAVYTGDITVIASGAGTIIYVEEWI